MCIDVTEERVSELGARSIKIILGEETSKKKNEKNWTEPRKPVRSHQSNICVIGISEEMKETNREKHFLNEKFSNSIKCKNLQTENAKYEAW